MNFSVEVGVDREKVEALPPAWRQASWTQAPTWNSEGSSPLFPLLPAIQTLTALTSKQLAVKRQRTHYRLIGKEEEDIFVNKAITTDHGL